MTKRAIRTMPSAPRRRLWPGVAVLATWVLLAYAPSVGAQSAVGPAAETTSNPQAPSPEQLPGPASSVAAMPGLARFQISPKFLTGVPIGGFGNKIGTTPGAAIDFTARLGQTPVFVGAALEYLRYGSESRRIALFPAVPEVFSDVDTTNNLFRTHALVRLQPSTGRVRPYAEGLLGFSYVYTRTAVDLGDEGDGAGTTHLGDFAPSFGAGGGVTIGLVSGHQARVALDIGLRYLTGGEVDYLTRGDLQRNENGVTFEPTRSPATLIAAQIGITVDF